MEDGGKQGERYRVCCVIDKEREVERERERDSQGISGKE